MAYTVNGKVYTDHPLMDEIVYNCKLILEGIVVKNDVLANDLEDKNFTEEAEVFMMIKDGTIDFSVFPFSAEILTAFGYTKIAIKNFLTNRENIPKEDRNKLMKFACDYFLEHYEEKNDYYRMLAGLPPYGTSEYYVYIDESYLPSNYTGKVDFSKPIHKLDHSIIAILQSTGKMDNIIKEYRGSNYSYLKFLGDSRIDIYKARKGKKYDILYIPAVEGLVVDRFQELFNLNRDIYLKRTYSEAYAFNSDYYEQIMILLIICQTFNDIIVEVPEWYIRRDIFDIRSVQYFLESFGVAYYKIIPLKYQIRIVKNLNKLIKYKSSNKNFADILEIFALKNTSIYKYYLYKKRLTDSGGKYLGGISDKEKFELEFIQAKINESYDDYIKDQIYRTPYDDITYQDKYWDGEDEHEYIKNRHMERDFTIERTKYMSLEYKISMSEYLFQLQYFLGLILDSNIDTEDIRVAIPSIQSSLTFRVTDLFIFLVLITLGYDNCSTKIIRPEDNIEFMQCVYSKFYDIDGGYPPIKERLYTENYDGDWARHDKGEYFNADGKYANDEHETEDHIVSKRKEKPEFQKYDDYNGGYSYTHEEEYDLQYSPNGGKPGENGYLVADGGSSVEYSEIKSVEDFYDWMKRQYPEMFIDLKDRVYGFNSNINMEEIKNIVSRRHSQFQFNRGFTLEELGIDKYIVPTKISTFDELTSIYFTNKECYDILKKKMVEESDDRDEFMLMQFIFNQLFTKQFDYNGYMIDNRSKDADYLEEVLKDRDYVLYNTYIKIMSENNMETRKDNIRNIMNDIIGTLEYYLSGEGLEYIFAFATITSFSSLIQYIYLMINFFKSFKVYFLEPYITYVSDDRLENNARGAGDAIAERKLTFWKEDKLFARETIGHRTEIGLEDNYKNNYMEALDIFGHFDPDPMDDYDYNGMYANTETILKNFKDADGGKADPKSCIPYIMLNCGSAAQGQRINLWDLNGASAVEMRDYVDIDGGYPLHIDDSRRDFYGTAFTYIIDGGGASTNQFISKSMHIKVFDRQVESSVKISNKSMNILESTPEGLYLKQIWASLEDFEKFTGNAEDTIDYFSDIYDILTETLEIATDEELLNNKIQEKTNEHLAGMRKTVLFIDDDSFETNLKKYVDKGVDTLYQDFDGFSPYAWGKFE